MERMLSWHYRDEIQNSHQIVRKRPATHAQKSKMRNSDPWRSSRFKSRLKDSDRLKSEQFAQALSLGAADGDFCLFLVIHPKLVGTFEPGNDFLDAVDIHEITPMRAPEEIRIEAVE